MDWNGNVSVLKDAMFALQVGQKLRFFSFGFGNISYELLINVIKIEVIQIFG